jgi:hypothetical protein
VPSDIWVFPLLVGYDELLQKGHYTLCPPERPACPPVWVTETETYHWTEKETAQLSANGVWRFFFVSAGATCEPVIVACPT